MLTPQSRELAEFVDQQPPNVRHAFQFCIAVAMEENGAARLVKKEAIGDDFGHSR